MRRSDISLSPDGPGSVGEFMDGALRRSTHPLTHFSPMTEG